MFPLLLDDLCDKRGWFTIQEITEGYALAQSLPGPIAANVAVYFGEKKMGLKGAVAASFGAIVPAVIAIVLAVWILNAFNVEKIVALALNGVKSASIALICNSAIMMIKKSVRKPPEVVLFAALIVIMLFLNVSAYLTVLLAALFGVISFAVERVRCREK